MADSSSLIGHTVSHYRIVEKIRELVQGRAELPLAEGPEDIKRFGDEG